MRTRIDRAPGGLQFFPLGRRLHHFDLGALLALVGLALMAHDWSDRPGWR